ncbi:unnamed protein product [Cochlearia groenlandica]
MGRTLLETQAKSTVEANPRNRTGFNNTYFDTNMVIILAALLCALICALSLNSALRCVQRLTRRFSSNQNQDASNANANAGNLASASTTGIKKLDLKQIPIGLYGSAEIINVKATECLICIGDISWKVRKLGQSLLLEQPSPMGGGSRRNDDVAVSVVGT